MSETQAARAVAFDIGGVLELTPATGWPARWEERLRLNPGDLKRRLGSVWRAGAIGTISERHVTQSIREILGLGEDQAAALLADMWAEYLGTLNAELASYARGLRARCRTGRAEGGFRSGRFRRGRRRSGVIES